MLPQPANGDAPSIFHGYTPPAGCYDERLDMNGAPRAHWSRLDAFLDNLGAAELTRRDRAALRQLQENGATYNVHGDARGGDHPWELDVVPFVLHESEWWPVAEGLAQRARLLNLVLADLYGPQRTLKEGLIPPEIVFDNPAFLRPCHGLIPPDDVHLHFYGVDLARGVDGIWRVTGDLTQTPAGAGYVLENRIVLSRLFADLFRDSQVYRLAHFFQQFRETLVRLAPRHRDNPRIVMLSGGPEDETYFEHAYLARYLGMALVEGEDLAARDQAAWLKMLGGLQPVDVLVRRVRDDACDPLELSPQSTGGCPGLLQAVRFGQVAVVNALGSGLLESPAFMPFLPGLCRHFLAEDLRTPSIATWWCGDPASRSHVLANLDTLKVSAAIGPQPAAPDLAAAILAQPHRFVAQERLRHSTVPTLETDGMRARHVTLRTYVTATADGYMTMPGGLARATAGDDDGTRALLGAGGVSKDTWIVSDQPVSEFSLLGAPGGAVDLSRGGGDLPSRVADNLFWLGRYSERVDSIIRVARVLLIRLSERPEGTAVPHLARYFTALGLPPPEINSEADYKTLERAVMGLLFDDDNEDGLRPAVDGLRRVAGVCRDRLSVDTWRMLNRMEVNLEEMSPRQRAIVGEVVNALERITMRITAFFGITMESMTRGQGWIFLDMGRRLERAVRMTALLRHTLVEPDPSENLLLEDVLDVADSAMTYRRRYLTSLQATPVIDLLMTDETNPRSILFQLAALSEHVANLPRAPGQVGLSEVQRVVTQSLTRLRLADLRDTAAPDATGRRTHLETLTEALLEDVPRISDCITRHYLSHASPARQLDTVRLNAHALPHPS